MYAVIKTGGKQYRVAKDDVISVEKLDGEPGGVVEFDQILMLDDGKKPTVGTSYVTVVGERPSPLQIQLSRITNKPGTQKSINQRKKTVGIFIFRWRRIMLVSLLGALAFGVVACGEDDSVASQPQSTTVAATSVPAPASTATTPPTATQGVIKVTPVPIPTETPVPTPTEVPPTPLQWQRIEPSRRRQQSPRSDRT